MTPVQNVKIWWDAPVGAYRMNSPYNAALIDALKKAIPYSERSFDNATKVWTFTEKYLTPLTALLTTLGIKPTIITKAQTESATQGSPQQKNKPIDTIIVEWVKILPYDAALAAYRKAAMILHPDRGGDMAKMTALNAAWDRLQKEVYGQQ